MSYLVTSCGGKYKSWYERLQETKAIYFSPERLSPGNSIYIKKKASTSALLYWLHADCLLKSPWFYCFRGINGHDCDRYFVEDSSPGSFIIFPWWVLTLEKFKWEGRKIRLRKIPKKFHLGICTRSGYIFLLYVTIRFFKLYIFFINCKIKVKKY